MSQMDRDPSSEQEFELVSERYVFVPVLLWAATMLVATLSALALPNAETQRASALIQTEAATVAYGA